MMRRLAGLAISLTLLAACGGDTDKARTVESATTTAPESSRTGDLHAKLLTVADMPTGYSIDTEQDDDDDDDDPGEFCKGVADLENKFASGDEAEIQFQKGEASLMGAAALTEALGRFATAKQADDAFEFGADAFAKCTSFNATDKDGSTFKGTFQPLSFAKVGDETFAVRLSAEGGSEGFTISLGGSLVVVREDNIIMLVGAFGFGAVAIQPDEIEQIVRKAHSKL